MVVELGCNRACDDTGLETGIAMAEDDVVV
jgi:hypothetical protein